MVNASYNGFMNSGKDTVHPMFEVEFKFKIQ